MSAEEGISRRSANGKTSAAMMGNSDLVIGSIVSGGLTRIKNQDFPQKTGLI